jgi:carboxyl-terminal processing protease
MESLRTLRSPGNAAGGGRAHPGADPASWPGGLSVIRRRFLLGSSLLALFVLGWWAGRGSTRDLYANLDLFVDVIHKVETNYVDPVDPHKLIGGALKGMFHDLDPYSQYLDDQSYAILQSATQGSFGGIGVEVGVRDHFPTVISPLESTPAWEAGIRSGDVIAAIDGHSTLDLGMADVAARLRGPAGTSVQVLVQREGEDDHTYTLERRVIEIRSVPYAFMLDRTTGYLRLADFSEKAGDAMRTALDRLKASGARSLVLDLRQNPGGLLEQAVSVAGEFLPQRSLVVYTKGRAKGQDSRYLSTGSHPNVQWPVVVLIDKGSASAAEIVAGALQDLDRALVVGQTSFGKGSVQSIYPIPGEHSAVKLTTALYYTPSGRSIHKQVVDTLATDDSDEEEDSTPATTPTDSLPRARYHTAAGRSVFGGGGITPDLAIAADSLAGLAQRVESRGLPYRFATRYQARHPQAAPAPLPWTEFVASLRAEKVSFTDAELAAARPRLELALRREIARRTGGDGAAAQISVTGDPVVMRARAILDRARAPRDVFGLTATPGGRSRSNP